MAKKYSYKSAILLVTLAAFFIASCKKDNNSNNTPKVVDATPAKIGVYEADSSIYKLVFVDVTKVGNQSIDYGLIFDTGSGGMVLDGTDIVPKTMMSSSGFSFTGDSVVVNGITITNQKDTIEYGDDNNSTTKVYGNLAYAPVTIGDADGNIQIKRLPFFLYYKGVNADGTVAEPHDFDLLGVSPEYDLTFANNAYITSPFGYYDPGTGLTKGFKMAALGTSHFSLEGTYVPGVITVGLTASDLSTSSGFTMHQLKFYTGDGYIPYLPATITYNNKSVSTYVLFDSGTEPYSYIEDKSASGTYSALAPNSTVTVSTSVGFTYNYTVSSTDNLTYVENPNTTGGQVSIVSLEYFLNNEYMLNLSTYQLGLKNN